MFRVYHKTKGFKEPADNIYYLVSGSGLFLVKKTQFFQSCTEATGVPHLLEHEETCMVTLPKKLPLPQLQQITAFFKEVHDKHKSEAIVLLYWSTKTQEYKIIVPDQEVSQAHLNYKLPKTPDFYSRIGTIHSHGDMSAFHSCADHKDEANEDGFHVTIGTLNEAPTYSCSIVVDGQRFTLSLDDMVDKAPGTVPDEWMDKVTYKPMTVVKYYNPNNKYQSMMDRFWENNDKEKKKNGKDKIETFSFEDPDPISKDDTEAFGFSDKYYTGKIL